MDRMTISACRKNELDECEDEAKVKYLGSLKLVDRDTILRQKQPEKPLRTLRNRAVFVRIDRDKPVTIKKEEPSDDQKVKPKEEKVFTKKFLFNVIPKVEVQQSIRDDIKRDDSDNYIRLENKIPSENQPSHHYCEFCKAGFRIRFGLEQHLIRCTFNPDNEKQNPSEIFYCNVCNFGITDEAFFKEHESRCFDRIFKKEVNYSWVRASEFKNHRAPIGRYKCSNKLCHYTTDHMGHMNVHVRIHNAIPLCVCHVCRRGFYRLDSLRRHMFRHLNLSEETQVLESVRIRNNTATKITMAIKIKGRSFTIVEYRCKCGYGTPMAECLEKHISNVHVKIRQYKCNICYVTFIDRSNLRQHLLIHTQQKTFKCTFCSYVTVNKSYIKKHENQVHIRTKAYECPYCDYRAYSTENRKAHINSWHTKEKLFACTICGYCTYYQSNYITHVKAVHKGIKSKKLTKPRGKYRMD